jgi:hypothetical protein
MSAYIISKETMDIVVAAASCSGLCAMTKRSDLGRRLFAMNADAIRVRYSDCQEVDGMPGPCDISNIHDNYFYTAPTSGLDNAQMQKSVDNLKYQCSEGNVPERELYAALQELSDKFKPRVTEAAWKAAEWAI